ncbi:MAG: chemotaxis response regulator protein-glutamate methylesterase [Acidobacteria bacterium]|nr:MAG: chemotaxis response regulator protein-glutamate methylesterase [Acidobacteriota bacterium]
MPMKILLIDDSELILSELSLLLNQTGDFSRILKAHDGEEGIRQTMLNKPDVIILDLQMPRMDGFTFLRWLMANHPVPVLVFSSIGTDENIFKAMEIGAVDFIQKPENYITGEFAEEFKKKLSATTQATLQFKDGHASHRKHAESTMKQSSSQPLDSRYSILVIGASTGGPTAIQRLLEDIQHHVTIPIVICQHMPRSFTGVFANRLNMLLQLTVKEAEDGECMEEKTVYIAPGDMHLDIRDKCFFLVQPSLNDRYIPSVDRLMETAAGSFGDKTLAVILTGMGTDGSSGIQFVHKSGGTILAESQDSCVVYGMPKSAVNTGLVHHQLPLDAMGERIISLLFNSDSK